MYIGVDLKRKSEHQNLNEIFIKMGCCLELRNRNKTWKWRGVNYPNIKQFIAISNSKGETPWLLIGFNREKVNLYSSFTIFEKQDSWSEFNASNEENV